jgi:hypothetical protein
MNQVLVTLKTQPGCSGVSHNGEWYPAVNDRVRVPASALNELLRPIHGNALVPDEAPAKPQFKTLSLKKA